MASSDSNHNHNHNSTMNHHSSSDSQPLSQINNISLSPRKRKRNNLHLENDKQYEPLTKRHKTETDCNTNSHTTRKQHEMVDLTDDIEYKYDDTNWRKKVLGTLKLDYSVHRRCSILSIWHIPQSIRRGDITINSVYKQNNFFKKMDRLVRYYQESWNEFKSQTQMNAMGIKVALKQKKLISGKSEAQIKAEYDAIRMEEKRIRRQKAEESQRVHRDATIQVAAKYHALSENDPFRTGSLEYRITEEVIRVLTQKRQKQKPQKRKTVVIDSKYTIEFEVTLIRRVERMPIAYTLAVLAHTRSLATEIHRTLCVRNRYKRKHLSYTLGDLLDFACRYTYDTTQCAPLRQQHALSVTLHEYQLQSLDWMLREERDSIGFHRHLYARGAFKDGSPFYYSTVFEHLLVGNEASLPIAHGGFLCEEMGLGKTIISLALINCNKAKREASSVAICRMNGATYYKSRATLIIAPVSLVGQWETECDDKSNHKLKYTRYYSDRSRNVHDYLNVDIVFTTYGIMQMECGTDRNKHILHCIAWHRIILDESHSIKSGNCVRSKSINRLKGRNKWCLSGTPFGNRVQDIGNQLLFIGMSQNHVNRLQLNRLSNGVDKFSSAPQSNGLMYMIQKVVMRHRKNQTFNDAPIVSMVEKEEEVILVQFSAKQRKYYDILYETAKQKYNRYVATGNVGRGYIDILSSLHGARQACSGYIYSKDNMEQQLSNAQARTFHIQNMVLKNSNKSHKELYEMAKDEAFNVKQDGECPICYECPLDNPLQTPCRHLFCAECIHSFLLEKEECPLCRTAVKKQELMKPIQSKTEEEDEKEEEEAEAEEDDDLMDGNCDLIRFDSKMKVLMSELKKIKENKPNEKSLIFTSFSKSLEWICSELRRNKLEYRTLCGDMTLSKRKSQFEEFSNNTNVKVFVLTVRTGAVGITLTAANHVFMMEPTFNAALHRQAINRVYRLGQKKKVFIHTMIMKDTIEERIWNINKHKKDEDTDVAGSINADTKAKLKQHEISKLFV